MQEEEKRSEETSEEKPTEEKVLGQLEEEEKRCKELEEKLTKLENIARVANHRLVELQREYELLKERYRRDIEEFRKYGYDRFALDVLEVLDNLERALESKAESVQALRSGIELIYRQFLSVLEKHGIRAIELEGKEFDPNLAEVVVSKMPFLWGFPHKWNGIFLTVFSFLSFIYFWLKAEGSRKVGMLLALFGLLIVLFQFITGWMLRLVFFS
jgi:molecular chaperone GrpE